MKNFKECKILVFAPWIPPHRNSEAHVTGRLLLAFIRAGIDFDVISSPRTELAAQDNGLPIWAPLAKYRQIVSSSQQDVARITMHRVSGVLSSGHILSGGMTWVDCAIRKGRELTKFKKYDLIMSRSQPAIGHLPAMILSKEFNIPWIANWNDTEPAERAPIPYGKGMDAKIPYFFDRYLRAVIDSATWHTFCAERSRIYMSQTYPALIKKSSVIPHLSIINYDQLPKYSKSQWFTIYHAGTFDGRRSPVVFFKALEIFLECVDRKNVRVNFLGNSYDGETGFEIPKQLIDIVQVLPWVDYETTGKKMAEADVLMVIEAEMEESIFLPGKFVEYVSCNRPILALTPRVGTIREIMEHAGGGICADCDSVEQTFGALLKFYEAWTEDMLHIRFPLNKLQRQFDARNIIAEYVLVKDMLDKNNA